MIEPTLTIAIAALTGLSIVVAALLKGWTDWLRFKQLSTHTERDSDRGSPMGAARIELADLKERIRKLEAIANGVDL